MTFQFQSSRHHHPEKDIMDQVQLLSKKPTTVFQEQDESVAFFFSRVQVKGSAFAINAKETLKIVQHIKI